MDRRRFLGLVGATALGSVGAADARGTRLRITRDRDRLTAAQEIPRPRSGSHRIRWSADVDGPSVAITFDDGPDPLFTPRILSILERSDAVATFFVMAHNAERHTDLLREVVAAGHEIGGHGWNHRDLAEAKPDEARREVQEATERIEDLAQVPVRVFRPPYGHLSEDAIRLLGRSGRETVIWSVTRGELAWKDPARIVRHVVESLQPGDIIDLHDGIGRATFFPDGDNAARLRRRRETEVDALPGILEGVRTRGLQFETVSALIAREHENVSG